MLFAQLAIHTARLLNYDEKKPPFGYTGWNGAAIAYWRDMLQYRPITPGLEYPELPIAITHGSSEIADDGFDSLHDESEFTPMTDESFVPLAPRV